MKAIKKWLLLFGVMLMACFCAGCGKKGTENIEAGMAAIENLEYSQALACFEKAIVNGEDLELAYRGQGIAYMGLMQYEEAIGSFEKALKSSGMFPGELEYDINFYLATAKYKMGDNNGAIGVFDGILALEKKNRDAYFLRGSAKIAAGDIEGGVSDLEKAMELSGNSTEMLIDAYKVLADNGREQEGNAYLTKAMEKGASMSDYEKGTISYYLKDYENARNYLETARTDNKNKADKEGSIVYMLGQTYEQLGDNNYAAVLYEGYLTDSPNDVEIYNRLGLCKLEAGDYQGALNAFQAAMQVESDSLTQNLKYNEIVAYEYLGDFTKAKVLMETYLKAYPDDGAAVREYEFLKTR